MSARTQQKLLRLVLRRSHSQRIHLVSCRSSILGWGTDTKWEAEIPRRSPTSYREELRDQNLSVTTVKPRQFELEGTTLKIRIGKDFELAKILNFFLSKIHRKIRGKGLKFIKKFGESEKNVKSRRKCLYQKKFFFLDGIQTRDPSNSIAHRARGIFDDFWHFFLILRIFLSILEPSPEFFDEFWTKKKNLKFRQIEILANSNFEGGPLEFELARFYCIW